MDDEIPEFPTRRLRLVPCQICGRQFNTESLSKHQAICRKVSTKKRKIFDTGKQRAKDSDVPYKATKRTTLIYTGQASAQDERSKPKANWREKHEQLIRSIREARSVTRAMKEGGPLPVFRPSEVPSDYVACPYCHRNFNEHSAKRHIPFCQAQHERKTGHAPKGNNQQLNRGRTLPPQNSSQYRQQQPYPQSSNSGNHSGPHDVYSNGYKHSNSAPMIVRRNPAELPPPPPPAKASSSGGGWSLRKMFGFGSKEEPAPPRNYYEQEDDYGYEPASRYPPPQAMVMRTGRNTENTSLNVRARQRNDDVPAYRTRGAPPPPQPPAPSYGSMRSQQGNSQMKATRPTAIGRAPPAVNRCGECGSMFSNASARFCPQCGSRR